MAFISESALSSIFIQNLPLPPPGYYLSLELPSGLHPVKSYLPGLPVGDSFLHLRSPNKHLLYIDSILQGGHLAFLVTDSF